jgi:predicted nuclease with TOPRIM domain
MSEIEEARAEMEAIMEDIEAGEYEIKKLERTLDCQECAVSLLMDRLADLEQNQ